jgi:hypothetical protein
VIEGIGIALFGVAFLWAARYWLRLRRRVNAWPTVRGRVTERKSIQPTDRGRTSVPAFRWSPEVRFIYRVGGADYIGDKIWLPWSWTSAREKADAFLATIPDEVDVRYDPADAKTSCLYPPPFSNVLWYGIPGVLLLGIGVLWTLVKGLA